MQNIENPDLEDWEFSPADLLALQSILFQLEEKQLQFLLPLFSNFSDDELDIIWEILLDWMLFRHRWAEALWILEERIVQSSEYSGQPNFTYRFALALEKLGKYSKAIDYLQMTLDDWGGFFCQQELDMAKRLAPHFLSMYKKMF